MDGVANLAWQLFVGVLSNALYALTVAHRMGEEEPPTDRRWEPIVAWLFLVAISQAASGRWLLPPDGRQALFFAPMVIGVLLLLAKPLSKRTARIICGGVVTAALIAALLFDERLSGPVTLHCEPMPDGRIATSGMVSDTTRPLFVIVRGRRGQAADVLPVEAVERDGRWRREISLFGAAGDRFTIAASTLGTGGPELESPSCTVRAVGMGVLGWSRPQSAGSTG